MLPGQWLTEFSSERLCSTCLEKVSADKLWFRDVMFHDLSLLHLLGRKE